ncbi:MAG: hypothetical protein M0C28_40300 [Candidatus Moduliflexus flocculans]|nr:hypothetical protein [Candidatus Moduliflexus flocculans]
MTETWTWLAESFAEAPTERLVKSAGDLAAYRSLFENTRYERDYDFAWKRRRQVGEAGVVLCYLPKSPLMQLVALDAGDRRRGRDRRRRAGRTGRDAGRRPQRPRRCGRLRSEQPGRGADDPGEPVVGGRRAEVLRALHARIPRDLVRRDRRGREVFVRPSRRDAQGAAAAGRGRRVHVHRGHDAGAGRRPGGRGVGRLGRRGGHARGLLGRAAWGLFHGACLRQGVRPAYEGGPGGHALGTPLRPRRRRPGPAGRPRAAHPPRRGAGGRLRFL